MIDSEEIRRQEDQELVRRGRAGDRKAFEELFGRYQRGLFGFVRRFVGGAAEPADVYQEVVLKTIENIDHFNPKLSFKTWLFTLAANYCKNVLRSKGQRGKFHAPSTRRVGNDVEVEVAETAASRDPGPDQNLETSEFMAALERELANLPQPQREVFVLREFNSFSFKEIAAVLKVPEATARSRMFLAVDYLRVRLKEFSGSIPQSLRVPREQS